MKSLESILSGKSDIRLVGSSFGGLMAALFAAEHQPLVEKMILLAPAINFMEFSDRPNEIITVPVWIYHGVADEVIPLAEVETIAKKVFNNLSFIALDDDHLLHKTFQTLDWEALLS
jgi:pimeloyl-ACP methyl ester carboxylesterase